MITKRFFSFLMAIILVIMVIPMGQARADSDWSSQFESFVLNQEYLQSGLSFNADAYMQPRFSLYDLDQNDEPELLAFNGGPSLAASTDYVFTHEAWGVNYIGNVGYRGCELYYYEGSAYPGLFCSDGNNGVIRTTYYEMRDGSLVSQDLGESAANFGGTRHILSFYTLDEIRNMGWYAFVKATFETQVDMENDSDNGGNDVYVDDAENIDYAYDSLDVIPPGEQFSANIFLSNFSEQHAFERNGFPADDSYVDDLVSFAYLYCKINRRNMLDTAQAGESYYYTLSLENANTVLNRHFDYTLSEEDAARFPENEDPNSRFHSFYENGTFYFPAADGESYNRFTVVSHIDQPENGDNRYQMYFDIYELNIQEYMKANGAVDSGYYYMSASQAANDSRLTWENSGVALVKPYNNNGTDTYQLLYYRVGEKDPDPNASESSVTRRIYTKAEAYRSSDPRDDKGGCMQLGGNYEEFLWGNYLFETPSKQLSGQSLSDRKSPLYNLAMLCGALSLNAYVPDYLVQAYRDLGVEKSDIFLYSYPDSPYNRPNALRNGTKFADDGDLAFSIASMPVPINGVETDIVFITARGTSSIFQNPAEVIKDGTSLPDKDFHGYNAWDWIWEFKEDIFAGLEDYHVEHPELGNRPVTFVVSGHSLGGAAANLVAAELNYCSLDPANWYSRNVETDDIYCFTFGSIDSVENLLANSLQSLKKIKDIKDYQEFREKIYEQYTPKIFQEIGELIQKSNPLSLLDNNVSPSIILNEIESEIERKIKSELKYPIENGFENIINIYNLLDTFGPITGGYSLGFFKVNARGSSGYGKFGRIFSFEDNMKESFPESDFPSHEIVGYIQAVKEGRPSLDPDFAKRIIIACPVDVEILQGENTVCRIVSDQIVSIADNLAACVENDIKIILVPDGMDYQVKIIATDSGTMDYSVQDLSGDHDVSMFLNVPLTAGKTFYSEVGGKTETSEVRLLAVDSAGTPVSEIQPDGTELAVQENGISVPSITTTHEIGASAPPEKDTRWLIVAGVALTIGIICLVILLTTRRKKPTKKRS